MLKYRIAPIGRTPAAACVSCGMEQHYAASPAEADVNAPAGFCFGCGGIAKAFWKTIWDEVPPTMAELNAERRRLGEAIEAARRKHHIRRAA